MKEFAGSSLLESRPQRSANPGRGAITRDRKTEVLAGIIRDYVRRPIRKLLVVGCGSGKEAAVLAAALETGVTGIDLEATFDAEAAAAVDLRRGDATRLEFADGSFDFVYSFHVLEHIPECGAALREMRRVLSRDGAYCIGTPNRSRWVGYLGSQDATLRQMIEWNMIDWWARACGRFRNDLGAHAGFSSAELRELLGGVFGETSEVTLRYYLGVYPNHAPLLARAGLGRFLFPAVYFVGRK